MTAEKDGRTKKGNPRVLFRMNRIEKPCIDLGPKAVAKTGSTLVGNNYEALVESATSVQGEADIKTHIAV